MTTPRSLLGSNAVARGTMVETRRILLARTKTTWCVQGDGQHHFFLNKIRREDDGSGLCGVNLCVLFRIPSGLISPLEETVSVSHKSSNSAHLLGLGLGGTRRAPTSAIAHSRLTAVSAHTWLTPHLPGRGDHRVLTGRLCCVCSRLLRGVSLPRLVPLAACRSWWRSPGSRGRLTSGVLRHGLPSYPRGRDPPSPG